MRLTQHPIDSCHCCFARQRHEIGAHEAGGETRQLEEVEIVAQAQIAAKHFEDAEMARIEIHDFIFVSNCEELLRFILRIKKATVFLS